jgi:hypothetical protein
MLESLSNKNIVSIAGAFEIYQPSPELEAVREELDTLTRPGLMQPGDVLPHIPGLEMDGTPFILQTVNALGTPTCDTCVDQLEAFHNEHPNIPVITLTKQRSDEIQKLDAKSNEDGKTPTAHQRITIDQETAIDLGVALAPGQNADPEFWPTALRRTLAFIGADGRIVDIQQPNDQESIEDFSTIYDEAERLTS